MKNAPKIVVVAGARPNFMKIAPILRSANLEFDKNQLLLFHTGQHFDENMNEVFFRDLGIQTPDFFLPGKSEGFSGQMKRIITGFEEFCIIHKPAIVVVVGDVDSTLACALAAKKLSIEVAHVEAGLRSGDIAMPEEMNRICTDTVSDLFFTSEPSGVKNLLNEGYSEDRIFDVGNVMIDNLLFQLSHLKKRQSFNEFIDKFQQENDKYIVVTLHRPKNVDNKIELKK